MKTLRLLVFAATIAFLGSGCRLFGEQAPSLAPKQIDARLHKIGSAPGADGVYFLGKTFEGLPLTGIYPRRHLIPDTFVYGTCRIPAGSDSGCTPPLSVQITSPVTHFGGPAGCRRLAPIRRVPTVRFLERGRGDQGLAIFTGQPLVMLSIQAHSEAQEIRAAAALRTIGGTTSAALTLPAPADLAHIDKACGTKAGESARPIP